MRYRSKQLGHAPTGGTPRQTLVFRAFGISIACHLALSVWLFTTDIPEPERVREGYLVSLRQSIQPSPKAETKTTIAPVDERSSTLTADHTAIKAPENPTPEKPLNNAAPPTTLKKELPVASAPSTLPSTGPASSPLSTTLPASTGKPDSASAAVKSGISGIDIAEAENSEPPTQSTSTVQPLQSAAPKNETVPQAPSSLPQEPAQLANNTQAVTEPSTAPANFSPPRYTLGSTQNPQPTYPKLARKNGQQGDVTLGVHVNPDGSIRYLEILKGAEFSTLNFAAWSTVKDSWVFEPAMREDVAIAGFVEVVISFRED